jgi:DNA-directed RNA polymerase subunit F
MPRQFSKPAQLDLIQRNATAVIRRAEAGKLLAKIMRADYNTVRQRIHDAIHNKNALRLLPGNSHRFVVGELSNWAIATWPKQAAQIAAVLPPIVSLKTDAVGPESRAEIRFDQVLSADQAAKELRRKDAQIAKLKRQLSKAKEEIEELNGKIAAMRPDYEAKQRERERRSAAGRKGGRGIRSRC